MTKFRTAAAARRIAGSLGNPSKMPGRAYGLPAAGAAWVPGVCAEMGLPVPAQYGCPVGAILSRVRGSTCAVCYADQRGRYGASSVQKGQARRVAGLAHPLWTDAMVYLIHLDVSADDPWFRWHDSGDLLGRWHLAKIVEVAQRCPEVKFWLPTREAKLVSDWLAEYGEFPANLTVRVSATKVDGRAGKFTHTSTVHEHSNPVGHACPAAHQGGKCGDCRACWSRDVGNVSYHIH